MKYAYLCLAIIAVFFLSVISLRLYHIESLTENSIEQNQMAIAASRGVIEANKQVVAGLTELGAKVQRISDSFAKKQ